MEIRKGSGVIRAIVENMFKGKCKLEWLSKRQRTAVIKQWEARSASRNLYFYLCTSTTNRVRIYCDFRDEMIKSKSLDILAFDALAVLMKEVDKEMKWRACYPFTPTGIYRFKHIRL